MHGQKSKSFYTSEAVYLFKLTIVIKGILAAKAYLQKEV